MPQNDNGRPSWPVILLLAVGAPVIAGLLLDFIRERRDTRRRDLEPLED